MGSLEDKVAIVTGAAGGIGTAITLALAEEGARIVVCDLASRRDDGLAPLADVISDRGGEAIAMAVDVSRKADIKAAVAATLEAWSGVDILVNNAGTTAGAGPFLEITDADWQLSFVVNLKAPADFAQAVIPEMRRRGGGAILNIASTAGLGASASFGAYTATKHGLVGLSKTIAAEFGRDGIRCNAVCPGFVRTEMHLGATRRLAAQEGIGEAEIGGAPLRRRTARPCRRAGRDRPTRGLSGGTRWRLHHRYGHPRRRAAIRSVSEPGALKGLGTDG